MTSPIVNHFCQTPLNTAQNINQKDVSKCSGTLVLHKKVTVVSDEREPEVHPTLLIIMARPSSLRELTVVEIQGENFLS